MTELKTTKRSLKKIAKISIVPLIAVTVLVFYFLQTTNDYIFDEKDVVNDNGTIYLNTASNIKYVGKDKCYSCHAIISNDYKHSEMGHSLEKLTPEIIVEKYPQSKPIYDEKNNYYYTMFKKDDKYFQEEYRLDENENVIHRIVNEAEYSVGSGHNLRMYFYEVNGKFYQLPLTWNTFKQTWVLSPGYKENKNLRFSRFAAKKCINCHSAYLNEFPNSIDRFEKPFVLGIGCERCHGPGELHIKYINNSLGKIPKNSSTIVNPLKLSPQRQLSICMQCHLEGKAWVLQNEEGSFDFRAGQLLSTNRSVYYPKVTNTEAIEVGDSPHRLMMSKCFTESEGKLVCFTCHDVHKSIKTFQISHYNEKCISCHPYNKIKEIKGFSHNVSLNCVSCHMKQTGMSNTLHGVSLTDHWIRKDAYKSVINWDIVRHPENQSTIELVPAIDENDNYRDARKGIAYLEYFKEYDHRKDYLDSSVTYLEKGLTNHPDSRTYFNLAEVYFEKNKYQAAIRNLEEAIKLKPGYHEALFLLGKIYRSSTQYDLAISAITKAVISKPEQVSYVELLGIVLFENNNFKKAEEALNKAKEIDGTNPYVYFTLGNIYALGYKNGEKAISFYKQALALDPDIPNGYLNLGNSYAMVNNLEEAINSFKRQISLNPKSILALTNLGRLYQLMERFDLAKKYFKEALKIDPNSQSAKLYLLQIK